MKYLILSALVTLMFTVSNARLLGGDDCYDNNVCNTCAGYTWCVVTQSCIRIWETACAADELAPSIIEHTL